MQVYLHQVKQDSLFYLSLQNAAHWFWERGYEVIPFRSSELAAGDLADSQLLDALQTAPETSIVRATPDVVRYLLRLMGKPEPPLFELPMELDAWIRRFTWESTLGQVREQVDSEIGFNPFHIRPIDARRYFKGTIVYGLRDLIPSSSLPDDTPVLAQQKVEISSEWRAFVLRGRILHIAHLRGNPVVFPDRGAILEAVGRFTQRPIAFGMDWGVTAAGDSTLLEVNDGISYGNYGMHGMMHTAMIEALWRHWIGLADNGIGDCFTT